MIFFGICFLEESTIEQSLRIRETLHAEGTYFKRSEMNGSVLNDSGLIASVLIPFIVHVEFAPYSVWTRQSKWVFLIQWLDAYSGAIAWDLWSFLRSTRNTPAGFECLQFGELLVRWHRTDVAQPTAFEASPLHIGKSRHDAFVSERAFFGKRLRTTLRDVTLQ